MVIRLLMMIVSVVMITRLSSCGIPECEEPPQDGLYSVSYDINEGGVDVFTTDDARNSLEVVQLKSGQKTTVAFEKSYPDQKFTNIFAITDTSFDLAARDEMTCAEYVLRYGIDDVDTLKVCYHLQYSAKCNSTYLDSMRVYWNKHLVYRERYNARIEISK